METSDSGRGSEAEAVSEGVGATDDVAPIDGGGTIDDAAPMEEAAAPLDLRRRFGSVSGQSMAQVSLHSIVISERMRSFR